MKGFLLQLTDVLTIGPNATHTGFVLFVRTAEVLNTFADSEYHSGESVHHLVENIPNKLGKRTFIDRALMKADESLFTVEGGDRPVFPSVLVLLTDGRTNPDSESFSGVISSLKVRMPIINFFRKVLIKMHNVIFLTFRIEEKITQEMFLCQ